MHLSVEANLVVPTVGSRHGSLRTHSPQEVGKDPAGARRHIAAVTRIGQVLVHEIGTNDALIAAIAERLGGIVYTDEAKHLTWLRQAGARITVATVPF